MPDNTNEPKRQMTCQEAGRKGGRKRLETIGREGFSQLGKKGSGRLKELVELGKQAEKSKNEQA